MDRTAILNILAEKISAKSYLEIGYGNGKNFEKINCKIKISVDPNPDYNATICLTSDDFFKTNKNTFDLIFIDGLHHSDQVERDVLNALEVLNEGGYIVCHDLNPQQEEHQTIPYQGGIWNGDCWRAFVKFRQTKSDLEMFTIDADNGCGVIKKGQQELLLINQELNYKNFDSNRKSWLNLITPNEFYKKMQITENKNNALTQMLVNFAMDPDDAEHNFILAIYYDSIGQTASAVSYYIRTAERTDDDLLKYECLIKAGECFIKQGTRAFSVKGMFQHAVALMPKRPEAYFLLSRFHEREAKEGDWFLCYMISSIGLEVCDFDQPPLRTPNEYPGKYGLLFEKAISSWWCGLCEESRNLLRQLAKDPALNELYKNIVLSNLQKLNGLNTKTITHYDRNKHDQLRYKFLGSDSIERNFSESYQDMFVLTMLNGKRSGTYLEIGAGNPFYGNNTALLEKQFGWTGISLDIDEKFVEAHGRERKNTCLLKDATKIDYTKFLGGLGMDRNIDYLQLDCDPPEVTYKILLTMPFEEYKFAVITYEHDAYCDKTNSFREKSRKYLESFGYKLVVNDIAPDEWRNYEDWWVHPELVDPKILEKMTLLNENTKPAESYMLSRI